MSNETMQVYGVNHNGETVLLGDAPITPQMKRLDLVLEYFGAPSEGADKGTDADMCLWALHEYHEWLVSQGWVCSQPAPLPTPEKDG